MTRTAAQDTLPGRLADHLTELVSRLRLSSSPPGDRLLPPAELPRLLAAARLLGYAAEREGEPGLPLLVGALEEFVAWANGNPRRIEVALDRPLAILAEFLDRLLADVDEGRSIGRVVSDRRWTGALAAFQAAETAPAFPVGQAVCVLVLEDSLLRRMLQQKLRDAGCRTVVTDDPDSVGDLIGREAPPVVALAENLEPERHLERILALLDRRRGGAEVRCILVGGSPGGASDPRERARSLGADGVWQSPYEPSDLLRILDSGAGGIESRSR